MFTMTDSDMDFSKIDEYNRHGGAYDRGSCDAYYWREAEPHYFIGKTSATSARTRVEECDMSEEEIAAYYQGYYDQNDRKDWGDGSTQVHRKDLLWD